MWYIPNCYVYEGSTNGTFLKLLEKHLGCYSGHRRILSFSPFCQLWLAQRAATDSLDWLRMPTWQNLEVLWIQRCRARWCCSGHPGVYRAAPLGSALLDSQGQSANSMPPTGPEAENTFTVSRLPSWTNETLWEVVYEQTSGVKQDICWTNSQISIPQNLLEAR